MSPNLLLGWQKIALYFRDIKGIIHPPRHPSWIRLTECMYGFVKPVKEAYCTLTWWFTRGASFSTYHTSVRVRLLKWYVKNLLYWRYLQGIVFSSTSQLGVLVFRRPPIVWPVTALYTPLCALLTAWPSFVTLNPTRPTLDRTGCTSEKPSFIRAV